MPDLFSIKENSFYMLGDDIEVHEQVNRHDAKNNEIHENSHETKGAVKNVFHDIQEKADNLGNIFLNPPNISAKRTFANGLLFLHQTPGQRKVPVYCTLLYLPLFPDLQV